MISKDAPRGSPLPPVITGFLEGDHQRNAADRGGKKTEFYRSSQPDLLPAAVNQRSCVMAKHTSTGCLRPLAQPVLRSHPKTQGRKSMLLQIRARILTKAPVFPSVGFIFSPADVSFPRRPVGGSITSSALWTLWSVPAHPTTPPQALAPGWPAQREPGVRRSSQDAEYSGSAGATVLKDGDVSESCGSRAAGCARPRAAGPAGRGPGKWTGQGAFKCCSVHARAHTLRSFKRSS